MTASDDSSPTPTLPYGVFAPAGERPRVGVRVGEAVLDLAAVSAAAEWPNAEVFDRPALNAFMELGPAAWSDVRRSIIDVLTAHEPAEPAMIPLAEVDMQLPFEVADYVDFYSSESHASNVGKIFRPDSPALPANWKHLPIGYHGRAGTVVVSGTDVVRPRGQRRAEHGRQPLFGPSVRLDLECEVGFVVGQATELGRSVPVEEVRRFIFGVVLLNDWSARDIQAWEYVPLGPFLGKSFATSISAWVVPFEALSFAELPLPPQDPTPLPYLTSAEPGGLFGLDLRLEIVLNDTVVASPSYRDMYWSPAQMLAHQTVNGANLRVGDLFASGTVSGWSSDEFGSLLERTCNGTAPLRLEDGSRRGFLEDGDVVTLRGWAPGSGGGRVELGDVTGRVVAAASSVS